MNNNYYFGGKGLAIASLSGGGGGRGIEFPLQVVRHPKEYYGGLLGPFRGLFQPLLPLYFHSSSTLVPLYFHFVVIISSLIPLYCACANIHVAVRGLAG